ncbi:hypothetical protein Tco_0292357 [Tanacetum coccineum]
MLHCHKRGILQERVEHTEDKWRGGMDGILEKLKMGAELERKEESKAFDERKLKCDERRDKAYTQGLKKVKQYTDETSELGAEPVVHESNVEVRLRDVIEFCGLKGSREGFSNADTPQQIEVAAFRVYNLVTKRVEENLHIKFLENKPNVAGKGPNWLFDLDYLTDSMNYHSVRSENQANILQVNMKSNKLQVIKDKIDARDSVEEDESAQDCFELPIWHSYSSTNTSASKSDKKRGGPREEEQVFLDDLARLQMQEKEANEEDE